jgi:YesN/AraC family two-component response regulator
MPGLSGEEVARRVKTTWPAIAVIMLSGYPETAIGDGSG